jgi:tetratricopeptide (TPR) repeat protein
MDVASSPHGKSHARVKSRLQRDVVLTAIQLQALDAALRYTDRIEDGRRAESLAILAQAFAQAGDRARADQCVIRAIDLSASTEGATQERILTEIAVAFAVMGQSEKARQFAGRVPQDLTGRVEAEIAARVTIEELDRQCDAFDRAIKTGNLDVVRSGIGGYFAVLKRTRGDASRCDRAEKAIRAALPGLPMEFRIDALIRLSDELDAQGRTEEAIAEVIRASEVLAMSEFLPDTSGPVGRDLALAFMRRRDSARARQLLVDMVAAYERDPKAMVDIERADYLCPLAAAFAQVGDLESAVRVWSLAIDAGSINPNARPRAEDLCMVMLSMARLGIEPTEGLRDKMAQMREGLQPPW